MVSPALVFAGELCVNCVVQDGRIISGYYERDGQVLMDDQQGSPSELEYPELEYSDLENHPSLEYLNPSADNSSLRIQERAPRELPKSTLVRECPDDSTISSLTGVCFPLIE